MKYNICHKFNINNKFLTKISPINHEKIFHTISKNLILDYIYKKKNIKNKTSLVSQQDGDPVIFVVNGDYTVPVGTTITPTNRCKGLYMFINGTLTVNGTISMTARGANAEGRYIHIDTNKLNIIYNKNNTYNYKNKITIGATTGTPAIATVVNGTNYNCCGSGGIGGSSYDPGNGGDRKFNGIAGNGTSFSGGAGTGGVSGIYSDTTNASMNGAANGGRGGLAGLSPYGTTTGTGAGNPAGNTSFAAGSTPQGSVVTGTSGTGGLIIIVCESFINNGSITSNGSAGGSANAPGGGSGGGCIQIIYNDKYINNGTITVTGGGPNNTGAQKKSKQAGTGTFKYYKIPKYKYI